MALAGKSLAERQLELALALGCERVICLVQGVDKSVIALQHCAEGAGAKFNLIAGPRQLAGLVSAADELVVMADGLLPLAPEARSALDMGTGVLILPVEAGIAAGFERIDLNHAWAGLLVMPGTLVERLSQLPPDCDAVSALLRIALQGKVPERILPEGILAGRMWAMFTARQALADFEPGWLRSHIAAPSPFAPGQALVRLAMRGSGAALLARGWKPHMLALGALLFACLGVVSAWFEQSVIGMVAIGLGWMLAEASVALKAIVMAGTQAGRDRLSAITPVVIDLTLIAAIALSLGGTLPERLFAPLVLLAAVRLAGLLIRAKWADLLQDRAVLAIILALSLLAHAPMLAVQILSLAMLATILLVLSGSAKLTRA